MADAGRMLGSNRRTQFKATVRSDEVAERRRRALEEQISEGRSNRVAEMRRIAMSALLESEEGNTKEHDDEVQVEDDDDDDMDMDTSGAQPSGQGKKIRRLRMLHRTLFFARQFQMPDWMLDVPSDLSTNWLVQVRPEGERCLLMCDGGRVQVRHKNGRLLECYSDVRFPRGLTILDVVCLESLEDGTGEVDMAIEGGAVSSSAPGGQPGGEGSAPTEACEVEASLEDAGDVDMGGGAGRGRGRGGKGGKGRGRGYADGGSKGGGRGGKGGRGDFSSHNPRRRPVGDRKYAVCDVLVWGDNDMVGADAECRMFWLESRFSELSDASRRARKLELIPAKPVTGEGLSEAYHLDPGYSKDSLLFLHREGHYHCGEAVTPLALLWRDRHITRFVVDTPDEAGEKIPQFQAVVLELRAGNKLRTAERHYVAQLSEQDVQALVDAVPHGRGGKGSTEKKDMEIGEGKESKSTDVSREKSGSLVRVEADAIDLAQRRVNVVKVSRFVPARTRVWADSWGRIIFQHLHRTGQTHCISFQALMQCALGGGQLLASGEVK